MTEKKKKNTKPEINILDKIDADDLVFIAECNFLRLEMS